MFHKRRSGMKSPGIWARGFAALVVASLAIMLLAPSSFADSVRDRREQLSDIQKKLEQTRKSIHEAERRQRDIITQKRLIDQRIGALETELARIRSDLSVASAARAKAERRLEDISAQLRRTQIRLRQAEEKVSRSRELLEGRVVNIYKVGPDSFLDVLLGAQDFRDFVARVSYLRLIFEQDQRVLREAAEARDEARQVEALVAERRAVVRREKEALAEQERKVASIKNQRESRQASLRSEEARQNELLAAVASDRKKAEALEESLERESAAIEAWLASRSNGLSERIGTGRFIRPVNGRITSGFGYRRHPIYGYRKLHSGVDFGAPKGTPIRAADDGVVIFSGWRGGYGQAVILDHGGGMVTLYAHSSRLLVSEGARVRQGKVIALVGSTGASTGNHLHFEVRIRGRAVNPLGYL